jgi:hypothetical protein
MVTGFWRTGAVRLDRTALVVFFNRDRRSTVVLAKAGSSPRQLRSRTGFRCRRAGFDRRLGLWEGVGPSGQAACRSYR